MIHASKALVVLFVASLGLWGCTQGPANSLERIRTLEAKNGTLEDELRAASNARDQLKKQLAESETQRTQQAEQLRVLRLEKETVLGERNAVQAQYEQFRQGLKELLGRAEAGLNGPPAPPVTSTAAAGMTNAQ